MTATYPISLFQTTNNELHIGGLSLTVIEKQLGGTPFYAYDKSIIEHKIKQLKDELPEKITLHYAIKANPYPELINYIANYVDGFDVASGKEMQLALHSHMPAKAISFAGPGKNEQDIEQAILAGVTLHIESFTEMDRVLAISHKHQIKPHIAIRVNPLFELKASGMKMSGGSKPFGIDEELLAEYFAHFDFSLCHFRGFHIFTGSQNLNPQALIETHQKTFALAKKLAEMLPVKLDYINIGGGLGIPYFSKETPLELTEICQNLTNLIEQYHSAFADTELIMELGRYLVGEAGVYVSKVVDKKTSRGTHYLICDGGLHHHLANSGNFGQVIRKNYPVAIGNKLAPSVDDKEVVNIVGLLCTPLDIIADRAILPRAEINDYVVVFQSGAYGLSASPVNFLSQKPAKEILL